MNKSRQGIAFLLVLLIVAPIVGGAGWLHRRHAKKVQAKLAAQHQTVKAAE